METYKLTLLFNGAPTTTVIRRYGSPTALLGHVKTLGEGWGARISITDEQARRLGVYESTCGEMLMPVADEAPLTVTIRRARVASCGHQTAIPMSTASGSSCPNCYDQGN